MFVTAYCTDKQLLNEVTKHITTSGVIYPYGGGLYMLQGTVESSTDVSMCVNCTNEAQAVYLAQLSRGLLTACLYKEG